MRQRHLTSAEELSLSRRIFFHIYSEITIGKKFFFLAWELLYGCGQKRRWGGATIGTLDKLDGPQEVTYDDSMYKTPVMENRSLAVRS